MSGICAVIDFGNEPVDRRTVETMIAAARHRGPHGTGLWHHNNAALGHLALHTTPESQSEKMPLADGDLVLVADARLDNREELLGSLPGAGTKRNCGNPNDAELILAAYKKWGQQAPAHLIGDFAFAIWDSKRNAVFAARDAVGSRPLYFRRDGRRLYVASEVKQILSVWPGPHQINERMLGAWLCASGGRPEWTFYEGVDQLPPAHGLVATPDRHQVLRYWDIDPDTRIRYKRDDDYVEHFRALFVEVIRSRMRTTKPIGISLSGGMDSGAVASTLGHLLERGETGTVRTFSFAFEELSESDERHISSHIVARYGLESTGVPADDAWPLRGLPDHGPDRDEPFMGAFQVLHDRVRDLAVQHGMGTMVTAARGDNIAGGDIYDYPGLLRFHPVGLWQDLRTHARLSDRPWWRVAGSQLGQPIASQLLPDRLRPAIRRAWHRHPTDAVPTWLRRDFVNRTTLDEVLAWHPTTPSLGSRSREKRYNAVFSVFSSRGGIWRERNNALRGLGYVDPWADRRLAEFALAVPQYLFNRAGETKALVRRSMKGIMPEESLHLAGKIVPAPLYRRGLHDREQRKALDLLGSSRLADLGYLDKHQLLNSFRSQESEGSEWPVLATELWLRSYWE